ncbi:MAG: DUF4012 domain-containing protein [Ruminococcaceae bacterium]|nr:DUF4012 domain-containing protein [Oscillospiraceae bacterium]
MSDKDFNIDDILNEYNEEPFAEEEPAVEEVPEAAEESCEEEYFEEEYLEEECPEDEAFWEEEAPRRRKRRRWPWVVLAVFLLLVGSAAAVGFYAYGQVKDLAGVAFSVVDEAQLAVDQVKSSDFAAVERTVASLDAKLDHIDAALDKPLWKLAARVPGYGDDLTALRMLFPIWDNARDGIVKPALTTLQAQPLPDLENPDMKALLKDSEALEAYIDLALAVIPECQRCMEDFKAVPELSIPQLEEKMAEVRGLIQTVEPFLPLMEDVLENAAKPAVETLKNAPLEELKLDERVINRDLLLAYLDLAETLVPLAEGYVGKLEELAQQLPSEDLSNLLLTAGEKGEELLTLYRKGEKYVPLARAFLDHEEEQIYLLAIQNATEIRSAGGFPGEMCILYMGEGVITISSFMSTYNALSRFINYGTFEIPPIEPQIFFEYVYQPRDAGINPHFPRVAETWAQSPHRGVGTDEYDGVISVSPTLMQDFLEIVGGSIELSNGVTLDASNIIRYLQHDIYFDYFNIEERTVFEANGITDELFSEVAKAVLEMAFDAIKLDKIGELIDMLDRHIADRRMMFWLADPAGQAVIEELGATGALNSDPEKPEVGVYFNGCTSSKLGWFVNMETEIGEGRKTGDVMTYPVTVTLEHTLTMDEFMGANPWVVGDGLELANMKPCIYIFAPAGGTVSNFVCSNNMIMQDAEYEGLDLGYYIWAYFALGEKIVITCDVTTAPGVEAVPTFSKTPTLQNYR